MEDNFNLNHITFETNNKDKMLLVKLNISNTPEGYKSTSEALKLLKYCRKSIKEALENGETNLSPSSSNTYDKYTTEEILNLIIKRIPQICRQSDEKVTFFDMQEAVLSGINISVQKFGRAMNMYMKSNHNTFKIKKVYEVQYTVYKGVSLLDSVALQIRKQTETLNVEKEKTYIRNMSKPLLTEKIDETIELNKLDTTNKSSSEISSSQIVNIQSRQKKDCSDTVDQLLISDSSESLTEYSQMNGCEDWSDEVILNIIVDVIPRLCCPSKRKIESSVLKSALLGNISISGYKFGSIMTKYMKSTYNTFRVSRVRDKHGTYYEGILILPKIDFEITEHYLSLELERKRIEQIHKIKRKKEIQDNIILLQTESVEAKKQIECLQLKISLCQQNALSLITLLEKHKIHLRTLETQQFQAINELGSLEVLDDYTCQISTENKNTEVIKQYPAKTNPFLRKNVQNKS